MAQKKPLQLNSWRAPEVLMGPAFGETALLHPVADMRKRQLCWLHLLVNLQGLVGQNGAWQEPTAALRVAMQAMQWSVRRNVECSRARLWPVVAPEPAYRGAVKVTPQDTFPLEGAVFSDGSVMQHGGAAALQPDTDMALWARVEAPRSSTQCELVALCLGMAFDTPQILTDSLTALLMVRGWQAWPAARMLRCPDGAEVRMLLDMAERRASAPVLEKVKAHNADWLRLQHPMAVGNDDVDALAKRAAQEEDVPSWPPVDRAFADPVELVAMDGAVVQDVSAVFAEVWWHQSRQMRTRPRRWLDLLYPEGLAIIWPLSTEVFRRPVTSGDAFVHPVAPAVIKWTARVRAGCLATRLRLWERKQVDSAACLCCTATEEDDEHVLVGCPATGAADWLAMLQELWGVAVSASKVSAMCPVPGWLAAHRLQLVAALVPASLLTLLQLPPSDAA